MPPTFVEVLLERAWTLDAACRFTEDPDAWFIEGNSDKREPESRRTLLAHLTCGSCPVRRECLGDAIVNKSVGTWAATSKRDRDATGHLPINEAVDVLEAELPERLQRRIAAYRESWPERTETFALESARNPRDPSKTTVTRRAAP